jgi:hypothetical protein
MYAKAYAILFCSTLLWTHPLFGDETAPLAVPHPELYQWQKPPTGILGLPLGTFAVVEGTEQATSMILGSNDLALETINGKQVAKKLSIETDWPSDLPDKRVVGKHYLLHGYETAKWAGSPGLPAAENANQAQAVFGFFHRFVVTSIEKVDGVTVPEALPLDPKVPLAEPKIADQMDESKPPVGVLGLPLGTFAIINAHSPPPDQEVLLESPFEVEKVNGLHLKHPPTLIIRDVPTTAGNAQITLHGYEVGEWANEPNLPKSERPHGNQAQQGFQFYHVFVVTSQPKKSP